MEEHALYNLTGTENINVEGLRQIQEDETNEHFLGFYSEYQSQNQYM